MATLSRERFSLNQAQLAAALTLAGASPRARADLPAPGAANRKGAGLADTRAVDGKGGLTAEAQAALGVLADPEWRLSVLENRAGRADWTDAEFLRGRAAEPFVARSASDDEVDVALLPTAADMRDALDALMELSDYPTGVDGSPLELSLAGWAAALALADTLQDAALRARLARERPRLPVLTAEGLEAQLELGLTRDHTRWAVTAGKIVAPADLAEARGRMAEGMGELEQAGLLQPGTGGHTLTRAGFALADAWGQLLVSAEVTLATASGDASFGVVEHWNVFRGVSSIWMASWSSDDGGVQVTVREVSAEGAFALLDGLLAAVAPEPVAAVAEPEGGAVEAAGEWVLDPGSVPGTADAAPAIPAPAAAAAPVPAAPRAPAAPVPSAPAAPVTPAPSAPAAPTAPVAAEPAPTPAPAEPAAQPAAQAEPVDETYRGTQVLPRVSRPKPEAAPAAAAAQPAAEQAQPSAPAPAASGWVPTHEVPEGGLPAWGAPDPTAQPVATLGARLPVQLREERGAWAHVVCSNGWAGWVDGRRLVTTG